MASKKPNKTTTNTPTKQVVKIKTAWECENQCPQSEMCLAGKNYLASIIKGRAAKGVVCKGGK